VDDASGEDVTLIILEESVGYKFGCFVFNDWKHRKKFYGSAESIVFTLKEETRRNSE
jgi:hypothetical protein